MSTAAIFLVVGATVVVLVLTGLGFRPVRPLAEFRPDRQAAPRYFAEAPDRVAAAYRSAAARTPGMRIAEQGRWLLYLDSRPTSRILAGKFGVAVRARFAAQGGITVVVLDSQAKLWGATRPATLNELERTLRMRAKPRSVERFGT